LGVYREEIKSASEDKRRTLGLAVLDEGRAPVKQRRRIIGRKKTLDLRGRKRGCWAAKGNLADRLTILRALGEHAKKRCVGKSAMIRTYSDSLSEVTGDSSAACDRKASRPTGIKEVGHGLERGARRRAAA